ncbi:DUF4297 domain-containing protein [Arenibacter sp. 6A1]|uniref:dsDNA nuclease domain-containing protein n=1 Tax=Arenibacter sp. 6A1 TaxID=2720391 RepID=UPI00144560D9|nr:dsDNA nuclease domain-containing protein [Arenibacter sp. 6A1]NKI26499.1 DUF4297 domain-containing protein [Arenibacter sp. 6A1]
MNYNPLLEPQREKAGSTTFGKYGYQYHLALFRIIEEHKEFNEYAVFLELHEDVVNSNSLDQSSATFDFKQFRTNKPRFTEHGLTKKTKTKPSVLAKLVGSCINKDYSLLITSMNMVQK